MKAILWVGFLLVIAGLVVGGIIYALWAAPPSVAPIFAGALGFAISRVYEAYRESKRRLYDKKREVYAGLLKPYQEVMSQVIAGASAEKRPVVSPEMVTPDLVEDMTSAAFDAILYASDDVVKAYGDFRNIPPEEPAEESGARLLSKFSGLLKAMRRDLGHSFTALDDVQILRMFINFKSGEEEAYRKAAKHT